MKIDQNKALLTLKIKLMAKQKSERFLLDLQKALREEKRKLNELFDIMQKEEQDINNLEKISFVSLYYSLMGNKQQQIKTEQMAFFAAKLKFDSCQSSINSLKREILTYQNTIDDSDRFETKYIESIKNNPNQLSVEENEKLIKSADEIAKLESNNIEIAEAIASGKLAKAALKTVINKMQSASNWGLFDMFGGGFIVSAVKHSKINQSKQKVEKVNILIEKFNREISDISSPINTDLKIKISGFKKFADYFFDGLIFDWLVQSKIRKSLKAYTDTEKEISRIINLLLLESSQSKKQVKSINQSKIEVFE